MGCSAFAALVCFTNCWTSDRQQMTGFEVLLCMDWLLRGTNETPDALSSCLVPCKHCAFSARENGCGSVVTQILVSLWTGDTLLLAQGSRSNLFTNHLLCGGLTRRWGTRVPSGSIRSSDYAAFSCRVVRKSAGHGVCTAVRDSLAMASRAVSCTTRLSCFLAAMGGSIWFRIAAGPHNS